MNRYLLIAGVACAVALLAGCSSTPQVHRISPDKVTDVSGYWNDTDARLTAEQLTHQMLSEPWLRRYTSTHNGHKPVVIVSTVVNKSAEHINVDTFVNDIQRAIINAGQVRFVASSVQRGAVRGERKDQDLNASAATRKAMGEETGADFMLQGTIDTIIDAAGDTAVKYYQVNLQLINMANNIIAWVGQKKIKKTVEHSRFRF